MPDYASLNMQKWSHSPESYQLSAQEVDNYTKNNVQFFHYALSKYSAQVKDDSYK